MNRPVVIRAALLGVVLSCLPCPGSSAEAPPTEIEEITVVEPARTEAEVRAPSVYVSTIEIPELEGPMESTPDLLSQSTGIQVQRLGGLGTFSTISIRGSTANQVPVYLDGVPLSQAQNQTVNLSDLPLESLQRIEVYRGSIPIGFGGGGTGGAVNLVSRPPSANPETEISVAGGSFGTRKIVATDRRKIGEHGVLAHVKYFGTEGDFRYFDDNGTPENSSDDGRTTRTNNHNDSVELLVKTSHPIRDNLVFEILQEAFFRDQGVPGPGVVQYDRPSLLNARSLTYLRLRGYRMLDDTVDGDLKLFGIYNLQKFSDPEGDFGSRQDTRNQTALFGLNTTGTWYASPRHALSWFLQASYEHFFPYNETNAPAPKDGPDQSRLGISAALQDEITLLDRDLTILPSLRYEHLRDRFSGVNVANFPNTPAASQDRDLWSPSLGIVARLRPWLALRTNIAYLQRAPNFSELFGNAGSTLGNAELTPETATNRDIGLVASWKAPDEVEWLDLAVLEYAYFYNDVRDLIAFDAVSPGKFRAFNLGSTRVTGHEVSVSAEAFEHLGLAFNFTEQDTENRRVDSPEGNRLPLRASRQMYMRPRVFAEWGSLYYEFTYLGDNPTDRDNFLVVPSRTIHTVGGTWKPLPWLTAKVKASNLTDEDIRDLGAFPLPGISVFAGLSAEF